MFLAMNKEEILSEARKWVENNTDLVVDFISRPPNRFNHRLIDAYKFYNPRKEFHPDIINERNTIETEFSTYPLDHKNKIIHFKLYKIGKYEGKKFEWNGNKKYIGIDKDILKVSIWHNYIIEVSTEMGIFQIEPDMSQRSLKERWQINTTPSGVKLYAIPLHLISEKRISLNEFV